MGHYKEFFSYGGDKGYFYSLLPSFPHITFPSPSSSFSCPERRYQLSSDLFYFTPPLPLPFAAAVRPISPHTQKGAAVRNRRIESSGDRGSTISHFLTGFISHRFFSCDLCTQTEKSSLFCCIFCWNINFPLFKSRLSDANWIFRSLDTIWPTSKVSLVLEAKGGKRRER